MVVDRDGTGGGDARAKERRVALGERASGVARSHLGELAARGELGVPTPSVVARALEVAKHIPRQRHLRVCRARFLLRATGIRVDHPQAVAMAIARHLRVQAGAQKRLRRTRGARVPLHRRGKTRARRWKCQGRTSRLRNDESDEVPVFARDASSTRRQTDVWAACWSIKWPITLTGKVLVATFLGDLDPVRFSQELLLFFFLNVMMSLVIVINT